MLLSRVFPRSYNHSMQEEKPDIVFIHPQGRNWFAGARTDLTRAANIMPPLGIMSLAAYLEKNGLRSEIIDCYAEPMKDEEVADRVGRLAPPFAGFTVTTSSFRQATRMAGMIKKRLPSTRIVFGGAHVSAMPEDSLRGIEQIDFGVAGEGEETLLALMNSSSDAERASIPGLVWRCSSGNPVFNGRRPQTLDLDGLPFPAYEKLRDFPARYRLPLFNYPRGPGTTMISARGCPYKCTFCDRSVFGSSFRFNSAEYIFEHVRFLRRRFGIRHVNFYDDLFTLRRERVLRLTDLLTAWGPKITFNCSAQVSHIDAELVSRLKRAGCWMISLGLETGDPGLLKEHKRGAATIEKGEEALRIVKAAGLRAKGLFICGLPGETEETFLRTADFIRRNPIDDINMTKFTPFPGSPLYRDLAQRGIFEEDWEAMNCTNFTFVPRGLTREKLEALYRDFNRRYYSRPSVMWNYVSMLWKSPESWARLARNFHSFTQVRWQVMAAASRAGRNAAHDAARAGR